MSADSRRIIERLDGVRETRADNWIARCPAHDDRSPSLAIRECDDRTILMKCFAGCSNEAIVHAVGMELRDLFPNGPSNRYERQPLSMPARDSLAAVDHEALVVVIIANDILEHREIDEATWERLALACSRIGDTRARCYPARKGTS